jgi:hypothetical protein
MRETTKRIGVAMREHFTMSVDKNEIYLIEQALIDYSKELQEMEEMFRKKDEHYLKEANDLLSKRKTIRVLIERIRAFLWKTPSQEDGAKLQELIEEMQKEAICVLPCPFKERLHDELGQLKERLGKLDTFIHTSPVFETLPQAEQNRLGRQSVVMDEYRQILEERIEAMETTETS